MAYDWAVFQIINGWAGRWPLLDGLMRLLVNDYGLTTLMALGLVALWFEGRDWSTRERNQRAVLMGILALMAANVALKLCNLLYFRPRPFQVGPVTLLFYRPTDSSLPSNVAVVGFSLAVSVWSANRKAGLGLAVVALLLGFARIFCGVHYPADVLAGALLGGVVAYALAAQRQRLAPLLDIILGIARRMYLA
jgi:undecaprenyl-diphosphatase